MTIKPATSKLEIIREVIWELFALGNQLGEIRENWANDIGVSGPQWMILALINRLDQGKKGVTVTELAMALHVNASYITGQTKKLEQDGLITRRTSKADGRVVLMSVTKEAKTRLNRSSAQRDKVNSFVFASLTDRELTTLLARLKALKSRAERAVAIVEWKF